MGSRSSSKTANTTKNFNIVNNNTAPDGGGGSALAKNLNAVESELTFGDITLTDEGAIEAGKSVAIEGIGAGIEAIKAGTENTRMAYEDVGAARDWAGLLAGDAVDQFQRTTETALQRNMEAVKNAFSFARDSERSDGALTLEAMAPYGMAALVLIALVYLISRRGNA